MLIVLAALTTVALAIVLIGLAAWWVVIPPVVMLGGYLLLLREARHADADRAFILANAERRDAQAARLHEARAAARQREEARRRGSSTSPRGCGTRSTTSTRTASGGPWAIEAGDRGTARRVGADGPDRLLR